MSHSILHILNGDATKAVFKKTIIVGDIAVWREMLCDGPVSVDLSSAQFWKERKQFFLQSYEVSNAAYQKKVLPEFEKIKAFDKYQEIVLWFEYDLFCQVNLMALCSYFFKRNEELKISLVCAGDENGDGHLKGLGEFTAEVYKNFYKNREDLSRADLQFCHETWEMYCSPDVSLLQNHILLNSNYKFKYLNSALKAHLRRFPSVKNGLNEIEQKIIDLIDSGKYSKRKIVGEILRWQKWYGFGDLQYFHYLEALGLLYHEQNGVLYLNERGKQIQRGALSYRNFKNEDYLLGGALKQDFMFDEKKKVLTKVY